MSLRPSDQSVYGDKASNGTTEVAVIAAPAAGLGLRLKSLHITSTDAAAQVVTLRNGISGATFLQVTVASAAAAPTLGYRDLIFPGGGFRLAAAAALMASVTSGAAVRIGASADVEPRV